MKRSIFTFLLALILILSVVGFTAAESTEPDTPHVTCTYMKALSEGSTNADLTTESVRGITALCMILDAVELDSEIANNISYSDTGYICAYGNNCVDLYLPAAEGRYVNMFYTIAANELYYYGYCSADYNAEEHEYVEFGVSEILEAAQALQEAIGTN